MNEHDERLQQWLEDEQQQTIKNPPEDFDPTAVAAYRWLSRQLNKEPTAGPPFGFADKIVRAAALRYHRRKDRQLYLIAAVSVLLCLLTGGAAVAATGAVSLAGLYKLAAAHSGLALVIAGFAGLLLADQRLQYRRLKQMTVNN